MPTPSTPSKAAKPAKPASTTSASIGPPPGLIVKNIRPAGMPSAVKSPPTVFALQSAAWASLQTAITNGLTLPITQTGFVANYGTFADQAQIDDAIAAFQTLQTECQKFGNPQTLIKQFSDFTSAKTPPTSVYGHGVWLAQQLATHALTITSYYEAAQKLGPKAPNWQALVTDLFSTQGVLGEAQQMLAKCTAFKTHVGTFNAAMSAALGDLNTYLSGASSVLALANTELGKDKTHLTNDVSSLNKDNRKFIGYTIAACAAPILCAIPPLYIFGALIDLVLFTTLAVKMKRTMNDLASKISGLKESKKQAAKLVADITTFNASTQNIDSDAAAFIGRVTQMVSGLTTLCTDLKNIEGELTSFTSFGDFAQQKHMTAAIADWKNVEAQASAWMQQGFIQIQAAPPPASPAATGATSTGTAPATT